MERRALLSTASGTLLLGAGCLSSADPEARIDSISLKNDRSESYGVEVAVTEEGETVFSKEFQLGTDWDTSAEMIENPVDGPGQYQIRATMDGREMEVNAIDHIEGDETCLAVQFILLDNGDTDWSTKSTQEC